MPSSSRRTMAPVDEQPADMRAAGNAERAPALASHASHAVRCSSPTAARTLLQAFGQRRSSAIGWPPNQQSPSRLIFLQAELDRVEAERIGDLVDLGLAGERAPAARRSRGTRRSASCWCRRGGRDNGRAGCGKGRNSSAANSRARPDCRRRRRRHRAAPRLRARPACRHAWPRSSRGSGTDGAREPSRNPVRASGSA